MSRVAAAAGGGFAVFWSQQESASSGRWDVYGQNFGPDGVSAGPAFRVNDFTTGDQFGPKVAASGDQQLVVWTSVGQDGSREGVYGRQITGGALTGDEFRVNDTTVSRQHHPAVAVDGLGRFLSVWSSFVGETGFDLFGQQYSFSGSGTAAAEHIHLENNRQLNQSPGRGFPPPPPTPLTPR